MSFVAINQPDFVARIMYLPSYIGTGHKPTPMIYYRISYKNISAHPGLLLLSWARDDFWISLRLL
ncbi:Uncharacterised protein [Pseudomonas luteola]|uniref:Uncharacterized protein n=1 Tax=Pseudomonas luteola TaxID=47886 RepID=A0A2X2CAZ4_PSELU|nr:Uncharacterised protein [Pseudomonas luteola]